MLDYVDLLIELWLILLVLVQLLVLLKQKLLNIAIAKQSSTQPLQLRQMMYLVNLILLSQLLLNQLLLVHQCFGIIIVTLIRKLRVHQQELVTWSHGGLKVVLKVLVIGVGAQIVVALLEVLKESLVLGLLKGLELLDLVLHGGLVVLIGFVLSLLVLDLRFMGSR